MTRSSDRIKEQVQETVRDLPVQAARLALFGVGRTLLLTDRVRKDYKEARETGLRPVLVRWRHDAEAFAGKVVGRVTDRVSRSEPQPAPAERPETSETPVARPPARKAADTASAGTAPAGKAAPQPDRVTKAAPAPTPKPDRVTKAAADSLPVPDYDTATLASVRARLRSLSAAQVSQLRDYEQANAARADFLRMYENRIAKLTSDS
jgi:hypothetical protein